MNNNKNYEHRTTNNTDIHKLTQIYIRQHRYTQDNTEIQQWFKSAGYGVSTDPADLNHCRSCTPASEDRLKESPKHVRQK
jgi:hypothetical protein